MKFIRRRKRLVQAISIAALLCNLLFISQALAAGIFAENDEDVFDKAIGWQGAGTVVQLAPEGDRQSAAAVIPIRLHDLEISPRTLLIVTYETSSTIELGTTITADGPRILFGIGSDSRFAVGVHTPGTVMLYGIGNGDVSIQSRVNGIPENELGGGLGLEAGAGVITEKFVLMTGATVTARASILNPNHDYGELDYGLRGRLAIKDVLFLRLEAEQSNARTRDAGHARARAALDYKLDSDYHPWSPALRVMFGVDGRIDRIERGNGDFSSARYAGAHVIFYKR